MYFDFHWEVGRDDNQLLDINYVNVKIKFKNVNIVAQCWTLGLYFSVLQPSVIYHYVNVM